MYAQIDPDTIYQGDIVLNYHFMVAPLGNPSVIRAESDKVKILPLDQVTQPYSTDGKELLVANSFVAKAMIITQTCDIQRREYIAVCPIFKLNVLVEKFQTDGWEETRIQKFIGNLKAQNVGYYFYLHAASLDTGHITIEESYVDLLQINSVRQTNIKNYQRIYSLSDKGRHWLAYKLNCLFGRPIE